MIILLNRLVVLWGGWWEIEGNSLASESARQLTLTLVPARGSRLLVRMLCYHPAYTVPAVRSRIT